MLDLCLFGDSISKGVVTDNTPEHYTTTERSFVKLLSEEHTDWDVTSYALFGSTIAKGQSLVRRHAKAVEAADVVVLEYGGNDSDFAWDEIAAQPEATHAPKTDVSTFTETYEQIVSELRARGKKVVLLNLPPLDSKKYFNWVSRGLDAEKILAWLGGSDSFIYRYHESYSVSVADIAVRQGVPLIDIRSPFLQRRDYSELLCEDGIHPNDRGHKLIASVIRAELPALRGALGLDSVAISG